MPLLVRVWIEAALWRLQDGPQMLGFQWLHAGAGAWALPVVASLAATQLNLLWALAVGVRALVPAWRVEATGRRSMVLSFAAPWAFVRLADAFQTEPSMTVVVAGSAAMLAILVGLVGWSLRALRGPREHTRGAHRRQT